ncbi:DUF6483 family protein [Clostridium sp. 'White wine YQ']|uniref:DUF6483 family protein n=1 Tax=Clostridium sp. 'White wine YQ' TaxID=3027474 RepID=UPI002365AEA3|nr:DUF6483 family protein [Clostridium sp. 'White wine YQ']MDD7794660.1 DUF6483 family protein [Clostridium sp. 'White wine YQ']
MIKNDLSDKIVADFLMKVPNIEDMDLEDFRNNIIEIYKQYTGFNYDLLKSLPSQELINLLTNERIKDFSRVLIVSTLLFIEGIKEENYSKINKSYEIFELSLDRDFDVKDSQFKGEFIKIMDALREYELPDELQHKLFTYYKDLNEYVKAEDSIYELAENNPHYTSALIDFYSYLLALDDETLEANDFTREEIQEQLSEVNNE